MNILIANLGNIRGNEIKALAEALNKKHTVTIASMAIESAYKGQAFSFAESPVRVNPVLYKEVIKNTQKAQDLSKFDGINAYEFYSTPADAVSIMLSEIMTRKPDIVICGLNNRLCVGQDIYCSSNIGMAMEAAFFGIVSLAVGIENQVGGHSEEACANAVKFIERNIEKLAAMKLPPYTFLNINIPTVEKYSDIKGIKYTPMCMNRFINAFEEKVDPKGQKYYWAKNLGEEPIDGEDAGIKALEEGYIVITPLSYDATAYENLAHIEATSKKRTKEAK